MLTDDELKELFKNGETNRDGLLRLFQTSGQIHYEATPVIKGNYEDLDPNKIFSFFRFRRIKPIDISTWDDENIKNFLKKKEILVDYHDKLCPTIVGALLFARRLFSLVGLFGITVTKFIGNEKDYNYVDFSLDRPVMNTLRDNGDRENLGLIDEAMERIKTILIDKSTAYLDGAVRVVAYPYPLDSIREAIVNAVAHRDYTISGLDIRIDIYPNRMEIESPGRLPNTITLESIKVGAKYYRNQILVQYLKEAGFMDLHSLGIPKKILKLCTDYTGKEPLLEEFENSFKVTLYAKQ